jgi:hypothetical protein
VLVLRGERQDDGSQPAEGVMNAYEKSPGIGRRSGKENGGGIEAEHPEGSALRKTVTFWKSTLRLVLWGRC